MKICMSEMTTMTTDLSVEIPAFASAGWKAIELHVGKLDKYLESHSVDELRDELASHGMKIAAMIGSAPADAGLLLAEGETFNNYLASLRRQFELCRQLDIPSLGIGSDPARYAKDNWAENAVRNLRAAGDVANEYGVVIGVEFGSLPPPLGPFILDSLVKTCQIVDETDHPNVGINLDFFHFYRGGGQLGDIDKMKPGTLTLVHFCDVLDLPFDELDDGHRVMPGDGTLPLDEFMDALRAYGYNGYLSLELLNEELWKLEAAEVAVIGYAAMEKYAA